MSVWLTERGRAAFVSKSGDAAFVPKAEESESVVGDRGPDSIILTRPRPALRYLADSLPNWEPIAWHKMTRALRRQMEAVDVTHEAYLKALYIQDRLRSDTEKEADAWFSPILSSTVKDLIRGAQAEKRCAEELILSLSQVLEAIAKGRLPAAVEPISQTPSPDVALSGEERLLELLRCVVELEESSYRLVFLVGILEHPLRKAAGELGISPAAASSRLCRTREEILEALRTRRYTR